MSQATVTQRSSSEDGAECSSETADLRCWSARTGVRWTAAGEVNLLKQPSSVSKLRKERAGVAAHTLQCSQSQTGSNAALVAALERPPVTLPL